MTDKIIKPVTNTPETFESLLELVNQYSNSLFICTRILKAVKAQEDEFPGSINPSLVHAVDEYVKEFEVMAAYKEKLLELNEFSNKVH
jgi:hypothetical protein